MENLIRKRRKEQGMSQEELAEHVGVAAKTVSYWENAHNTVTLIIIPLIASELNVPVYKLFVFLDIDEQAADKDYIALLQTKTGKELEILFNIIQEFQKIK